MGNKWILLPSPGKLCLLRSASESDLGTDSVDERLETLLQVIPLPPVIQRILYCSIFSLLIYFDNSVAGRSSNKQCEQ